MNAILRYHGAKWRIAPRILDLLPAHDCYVEPFGGSAAILLNKARSDIEVYNDVDGEVVRFFRVLREQGRELARVVALTPFAREEQRLAFEEVEDDLEAARRFVVRCWMTRSAYRRGGGGLNGYSWVYQRHLGHWTESRALRWTKLPDVLLAAAERLQSVYIEHDDWQSVVARYDSPNTLVYCDPPYIASASGRSWERYVHDMPREEEHEQLLDVILGLDAKVALSGYDSALYSERLDGWSRHEFSARDSHNNKRREVLWLSPNCTSPQLTLFGAHTGA